MKTPITDAAVERVTLDCDDSCLPIYVYVEGKQYEGGVLDADTARRLELDRAALMEALEFVTKWEEMKTQNALPLQLHRTIRTALSAARANFPNED